MDILDRSVGLPLALVTALALGAACHGRSAPPQYVDLIHELPRAERRAVAPVDEAIRVDMTGPEDDMRPAIVMQAPARLTWAMRFPSRAHLATAVMLVPDVAGSQRGVTVRVGVADDRTYEAVFQLPIEASGAAPPAWRLVDIDLSAYSGWQWSLFYRPWAITWRVIVSVDATPGGTAAWASPSISMRR